ncbi:sulfotransferase domain-containing protein [Crocosphaera sp. UHCC 0190]|uniref:sulfotransferase domain-containing protein n=1 Tax=Crocosphaera sp. UHCC 0190 TaxID=3110246 RepID=UPI002B1F10B6|nr:sulfotransferase domain-containing protein [Crocosphaera sp. UHCC 0190]MEA5508800.1 sulfotransferase domain-containing protein [Crocosphaera sp. UHCC 0190]
MNSLSYFLSSPRFIVIGGHKCGTSSLHSYFKQHPDILMPKIKGQDLLNKGDLDIADYQKSYEMITNQKIFGEVSSNYFQSHKACSEIKKYFAHIKLLMILRNPVDRAFSHFNMISAEQKLNVQFTEIDQNHDKFGEIIRLGFYYDNLKQYIDTFGKHQLKVFLFDSFIKNKQQFFEEVFQFIEVDDKFLPNTSVILRKGGEVKNRGLKEFILSNPILHKTASLLTKPFTTSEQRYNFYKKIDNVFIEKPSLTNEAREIFINIYREDILKTQELLDINLSHYL